MSIKNLFKSLASGIDNLFHRLFSPTVLHELDSVAQQAETIVPEIESIVKMVNAVVPNKTEAEIITMCDQFEVMMPSPEVVSDPAKFATFVETSITTAVTNEAHKLFPSLDPAIIRQAIAYTQTVIQKETENAPAVQDA